MAGMTIELSQYVIDAIAEAVVKKIQEPKTGHWIALYDKDGTQTYDEVYGAQYKCSKCGCEDFKSDYCPNCGSYNGGAK